MSTDAAPSDKAERFPSGIPFIVGNEGAERFSYYGMRAILYVYLGALYVQFLPGGEGAANAQATAVAHLFMAGVYAFPMIGAILADRFLGKYPVIFYVSLIYCAGHGVLAIAGRFDTWGDPEQAAYFMYVGLALIAIGSGGIKPCVSANVGDQFGAGNRGLVSKVFQIFYFMINFGSFLATMITPYLYGTVGPEIAFGLPGVLMALATLVFWLGRDKFVHVAPKPGGNLGLLDFVGSALLFSPVVALILAVFVEGGDFEVGELGGMSKVGFYADYVVRYVGFLAATSWLYFVVALLLFAIGLGLFVIRQRRKQDTGFLAMTLYALQHRSERKEGEGFFAPVRKVFGDEAAEGPPAVLRIILVFSMVSVFWALFDQKASTWIAQSRGMDRALEMPTWTWAFVRLSVVVLAIYGAVWIFSWVSNSAVPRRATYAVLGLLGVLGVSAGIADSVVGEWTQIEVRPEQIQALNPLMVMIIIPGLNALVYAPLAKRGITIKPLVKMTVGMFLASAAFGTAAILQQVIEAGGDTDRVHITWQVVQYFVMTMSEVLVSVTGLEFAYTQAPRAMKSTLMGFWLLCVTVGDVIVAFMAPVLKIFSLSEFFWLFTVLAAFAACVFAILARLYKGKTYLQDG